MLGCLKRSLLVVSSIALALAGCTYNEDDLHAGNPSPRDAGAADLPSGPDLLSIVDLPGTADLPGAEDLPTVPGAPDAGMPIDDAGVADVLESPDVAEDTGGAQADVLPSDAAADASAPDRDTPANPSADSVPDLQAKTDASADTADGPPAGSDSRDAGVSDSAADVQRGESGGLDSQGLSG